MGNKLFTS